MIGAPPAAGRAGAAIEARRASLTSAATSTRVAAGPPDLDRQLAAAPVHLRDGLLAPAAQDPDAGLGLRHATSTGCPSTRTPPSSISTIRSLPSMLDGEPGAAAATHDSMNDLSRFERDGWRSLRSAFASIWRMRSRVTSKS